MSKRRLVRFRYFYPFSLSGTVLFGAAVVLLGSGLARRNPYALFLAFLALAVLAVLSVAGRVQANGAARSALQWDSSATLIARRKDTNQAIHGEPARLLPFFRHHFRLTGTLIVGRGASLQLRREVSFASVKSDSSLASSYALPLQVPLCGPLSCRGRFTVRDVFGLTRSRYGEDQERRLMVQPASWPPRGIPPIEPTVGMEEKSRRRSSDEEKYYMREYLPGDRFRDINWKVSSRLNELITRISPLTQERTTVLEVAFRNYRAHLPETVESLAHLNVLKSWLISFLRRMKTDHPELQFRVQTASTETLLTAEEEIDRFAWELAAEHFAGEGALPRVEAGDGELFVFSTPFDRGLSRFLAANLHTRVHLFRTAFAASKPESASGKTEQPLRLLADPLEDLPGPWVLRRERRASEQASAPSPPGGSLTEEAFAVRVF